MKNTNRPRTKNSTRENIYLLVQKISVTRLIGYQDNTPAHINDLNTEKAKEPKNLDVDLSEFDRSINVAINKILYQNKFIFTN